MLQKNKKLILIIVGSICGIFWGLIYLFLSALHGMTQMFNNEFVFVFASIFKVEVVSKSSGVFFSLIDGIVFGLLVGMILIKISKINVR